MHSSSRGEGSQKQVRDRSCYSEVARTLFSLLAEKTNKLQSGIQESGILPVPIPLGRAGTRQANARKRRRTEVVASQAAISQNDAENIEGLIDSIASNTAAAADYGSSHTYAATQSLAFHKAG